MLLIHCYNGLYNIIKLSFVAEQARLINVKPLNREGRVTLYTSTSQCASLRENRFAKCHRDKNLTLIIRGHDLISDTIRFYCRSSRTSTTIGSTFSWVNSNIKPTKTPKISLYTI